MVSLLNPVAPFYQFMRDIYGCIPLAVRLLVTLCFGVMVVFALMKSLKGG